MLKRAAVAMAICCIVAGAIAFLTLSDSATSATILSGWLGFPLLIALIASLNMERREYLVAVLAFEATYTIFIALSVHLIFGSDLDAGYQLMVLPLPAIGAVALGAFLGIAAERCRWRDNTKPPPAPPS